MTEGVGGMIDGMVAEQCYARDMLKKEYDLPEQQGIPTSLVNELLAQAKVEREALLNAKAMFDRLVELETADMSEAEKTRERRKILRLKA